LNEATTWALDWQQARGWQIRRLLMKVRSSACDNELAARLGLSAELSVAPGIILFDGRCRFCCLVVRSLLAADPELRACSVHTARGRALAEAIGRVPEETFAFLTAQSAHFDVDAYVNILVRNRRTLWLARLIASTPTVITGAVYRWVARHRSGLSALLSQRWVSTIDADRFISGGVEG
jgi:predicted DCC family thiol-disulfide oxidoreductase YuxK